MFFFVAYHLIKLYFLSVCLFNFFRSKLGCGLWSGKYSASPENIKNHEVIGISPLMFKTLIGRGHSDFSTNTQQDAQEFFLHFLNVLTKNSKNQINPAHALKYKVEDKVKCGTSGMVKYAYRDEYSLALSIPLDKAINQKEVADYEAKRIEAEKTGFKLSHEDIVRPIIPLEECLNQFAADETVEQFFSSAINGQTTAIKTTRIATMPDYLMIQLKKFTIREDWTEIKLNVAIEVPDLLNLTHLRGVGIKQDESELPELLTLPPASTHLDSEIIEQLVRCL